MSSPIVTLTASKPTRVAIGLTDKVLARITGIPQKRLAVLESLNDRIAEEPWLDEAYQIACALNVPGIMNLIDTAPKITDVDWGFDPQDDLDVWRTDVKLPLRFAARLAIRFGFDDPIDIVRLSKTAPAAKEVWSIVASGERSLTPGICPWCRSGIVGTAGHLPTCLPHIMWGPRDTPWQGLGVLPKPRRHGTRSAGSRPGKGLKRLRLRFGRTQSQMATIISRHPNYWSRLETLQDPLNADLAEKIAATFSVTIEELYS